MPDCLSIPGETIGEFGITCVGRLAMARQIWSENREAMVNQDVDLMREGLFAGRVAVQEQHSVVAVTAGQRLDPGIANIQRVRCNGRTHDGNAYCDCNWELG